MKSISFLMIFLISTACFAVEIRDSEVIKDPTVSLDPVKLVKMDNQQNATETRVYEYGCTVSATGTIHSAEFGDIEATVSVSGPCNSSLADKLRKAIADLRAGFE